MGIIVVPPKHTNADLWREQGCSHLSPSKLAALLPRAVPHGNTLGLCSPASTPESDQGCVCLWVMLILGLRFRTTLLHFAALSAAVYHSQANILSTQGGIPRGTH